MKSARLASKATVSDPLREREDPRTRGRLSPAALRGFLNLAERWQLSVAEAQGLLGWISESTFHKYKSTGKVGALSYDLLTRISLCLGIFKALHTLFAEPQLADRWVKMPNSNVMFGGNPPIHLMMHGGVDGLFQVRRLLEARLQ